MKKILTATVALTLIMFAITGCNDDATKVLKPSEATFVLKATCDTTFTVQVPITGPINLCAGGKSQYKKILSYKDSTVYLKKDQSITLSNGDMNEKGWYYFPNGVGGVDKVQASDETSSVNTSSTGSAAGFNFFPNWLKSIMEFVFWAIVLILLFWLLGWLIREFMNWYNNPARRNVTSEHHEVTNSTNTAPSTTQIVDVTVINEQPAQNGNVPLFTITGGTGTMTIGNIHIHTGKHDENVKPEGEAK